MKDNEFREIKKNRKGQVHQYFFFTPEEAKKISDLGFTIPEVIRCMELFMEGRGEDSTISLSILSKIKDGFKAKVRIKLGRKDRDKEWRRSALIHHIINMRCDICNKGGTKKESVILDEYDNIEEVICVDCMKNKGDKVYNKIKDIIKEEQTQSNNQASITLAHRIGWERYKEKYLPPTENEKNERREVATKINHTLKGDYRKGNSNSRIKESEISVRPSIIRISNEIYDKLKRPVYILVMINEEGKKVAFKKTDNVSLGYKIELFHYKYTSPSISGSPLAGIVKPGRYKGYFMNDMFVIDVELEDKGEAVQTS